MTVAADFLAFAVVAIAAPLNWIVAYLLWRLSRQAPEVAVLRERAINATAVALIVSVFAVIFVNNGLEVPPLGIEATRLLTRGSLLALSTYAAVRWLRLYRGR